MSEITDEETPFVIPASWEWGRLGDLGPIFNGNSISERVKETKYTGNEDGLPFIATKDVGYGWQPLDYKNGVSIPEGEPNFKVAHQAAVLICCEGGSVGKKCGITDRDICFGNKLYALEPLAGVSSHFLLANYLTPTFFAQFAAKMTGIIGGISLANFNQLLVPLPPVNEQHRIVAKVDELMALCDQLEHQQTHSIKAHQTLVASLLGTLTASSHNRNSAQRGRASPATSTRCSPPKPASTNSSKPSSNLPLWANSSRKTPTTNRRVRCLRESPNKKNEW